MGDHSDSTPSRQLSRREMLIRGGQTLGASALALVGGKWLYDAKGDAGLAFGEPEHLKNYFAEIDFPASLPRISVARGKPENSERMLQAAIGELGGEQGIGRFIKKGDVVLIKPNVGFERDPRLGATTNPDVLSSLIRLVKEAGAKKILVADNPIEQPAACFSRSRIQQAAEQEGAKVILPAAVHFQSVQIRAGLPDAGRHEALGTWPIFWKPLAEANKVIGIAPVKDHNLCNASMSMKNWYGLLGGRRNQFHQAIHHIVSNLGFMMSPTLVINDGTRVMMRNGPTGGRLEDVKEGNVIVAGVDPIATDAWTCEHVLGRDPARLTYLQYAHDKFGGQHFEQSKRFGQRDWSSLQREGKIVETLVG